MIYKCTKLGKILLINKVSGLQDLGCANQNKAKWNSVNFKIFNAYTAVSTST